MLAALLGAFTAALVPTVSVQCSMDMALDVLRCYGCLAINFDLEYVVDIAIQCGCHCRRCHLQIGQLVSFIMFCTICRMIDGTDAL